MIFLGPTHALEVHELWEKQQQVEVKQREEAAELS